MEALTTFRSGFQLSRGPSTNLPVLTPLLPLHPLASTKRLPTYRLLLLAMLCELQHIDRKAAVRVALCHRRGHIHKPDCSRASS
jgi:hypothetical protein